MLKTRFYFNIFAILLLHVCVMNQGFAKKTSGNAKRRNVSKQAMPKEQLGLQKTVLNETIKKSGYSKVNLEQTTLVGTIQSRSLDELIKEVSTELNDAKIKKSAISTIVDGIKKQNLFVKEFEETYKDHIQGFVSSEKKQDSISVRLIILSSSFQSANLLKRMLGENQDPAFLVSLCNQRKSEILTEWKTNPFLA